MKRILFLKSDMSVVNDGGTRVASLLINELAKENIKVFCVSLEQKNEKTAFEIDRRVEINYIGKNIKRIRDKFFYKFIYLRNYVKKNNIDIIIGIGMGVSIFSIFSTLGLGTKIISCEHTNLNNRYSQSFYMKLNRYIATKFSDKIITLTKKEKLKYEKKYKIKNGKVENIYNFIDIQLIKKNKKVENIEKVKIITVGGLVEVKGYERLIKIATYLLKNKNITWEWNIFGDGYQREKLLELIKENNLEKYVKLRGISNTIYEKYKEADLYVLTSYYEGLPMALLEAKASGLPIISFDIETGPSEIVRDGVDGYLVKDNELKLMADKIVKLIENEQLRKQFSECSNQNLEKFEKSQIIFQWKKLINTL